MKNKYHILIYLALGLPWLAYLAYPFAAGPEIRASWKEPMDHCGYYALSLTAVLLSLNPLITLFPSIKILRQANRYRRELGLAAFAYAALHASSALVRVTLKKGYFPWEIFWTKPIFMSGAATFLIFSFLALTSNNYSMRMLGRKAWKRLHRLIYAAEGLILLHLAIRGGKALIIGSAILLPLMALQYARVRKRRI